MAVFDATNTKPRVKSRFKKLVSAIELREDKRYTQKQIAEEAGVSAQIVSRWMNNVDIEITTLDILLKLCAWANCNLSDLVEEVEGSGS